MSVISFSQATIARDSQIILSDVTFTVEEGEFVYLIGKVGSGKSTLIKALIAEVPLLQGDASANEFRLKKIKRKRVPELRRSMGIIFQDFQLLTDRNIFDNLKFVLKATGWKKKKDIEQRINEVMSEVGLQDKLLKMPQQLSGGEQQRVVIARALLNNPKVILADEPTGNLDPESSDIIMQVLLKLSQDGKTILMATHNYNLLKKYPSRILMCENGKVEQIEEKTIDLDVVTI